MKTYVIDANIAIAFNTIGLFQEFKQVFDNQEESSLFMSKEIYKECIFKGSRDLCKQLDSIKSFKKQPVEKNLVKQIKQFAKDNKIIIHQKKDNDFEVIATAIQYDADFIVTNDRALLSFFNFYKRKHKLSKQLQKTTSMSLAMFLRFMRKEKPCIFNTKVTFKANIKVYDEVEIPNFHYGIKHMGWTCKDVQVIFKYYIDNLKEIILNKV